MIVYVVGVPATTEVVPLVFVTARSTRGVRASVSVSVLLSGVGSLAPPGAAMVAVFVKEVRALGEISAVIVNVTEPEGASVTDSSMPPEPEVVQVEPTVAAHVQVAPVSAAGRVSVTVAPTMRDGPLLVATIV